SESAISGDAANRTAIPRVAEARSKDWRVGMRNSPSPAQPQNPLGSPHRLESVFRRNSSEKFSKTLTWVGGCDSIFARTRTANRLPSGARSTMLEKNGSSGGGMV